MPGYSRYSEFINATLFRDQLAALAALAALAVLVLVACWGYWLPSRRRWGYAVAVGVYYVSLAVLAFFIRRT